VDDAHAPSGGVNASDSAIDASDRIHSVWVDGAGNIFYAPFDTTADMWGAAIQLDTYGPHGMSQGDEGVAIALDSAGTPHVVWQYSVNGTTTLRLRFATIANGVQGPIEEVEDVVTLNLWHPTLAFSPAGDLTVAWLDGTGGYSTDGVVRTRVRHANGSWDPSQTIPDTAVVGLDNGPSMMITADGVRHITFVDYESSTTYNKVRYWYDAGSGWQGDQQPPTIYTHDPTLGPDGSGGLYIYAHGGVDPSNPKGIGQGKWRFHKPAGGTVWGPFTQISEATGLIDDATSTRWSQFFFAQPKTLDFTYWTHTDPADSAGYMLYIGTQTVP